MAEREWIAEGRLRSGLAGCLAILLLSLGATANPGARQDRSLPEKVSICQLEADPPRYNHKLIEVAGLMKHGFEDFSLFDPTCAHGSVWLDYGGKAASGTVYCCPGSPDRTRSKPLVIENIEIPLVDDEQFRSFDRLVHARPDMVVHATIVGRFFSGRSQKLPSDVVIWGGYGHLGCCSLLAIERVVSVDPQEREDIDYGTSPDQPQLGKVGCSYRFLEPLAAPIKAQKEAEAGDKAWSFTDPKHVAVDTLARVLKEESISGMTEVSTRPGRVVYEWRPHSDGTAYMVVVSRPYWLSFYAADPKKVAWVVIAAYESSCPK